MSRLTSIDPVKDARWDKFVEDHPFGQIYHLSGWKRFLENSYRQIKGKFYVLLDDTGEFIHAGLPVYEVKSWLTGRRLVSAPFATLFDPLVSDTGQMRIFLEEIIRLSTNLKCSYAEIRTLQAHPYVKDSPFGLSTFYKHHYLKLDTPVDKLWSGFHRTCVRQRISRANESGLRLRFAEDESDLMDFYRLLLMTRKRLSLFPQPYKSIKSLWDVFYLSGRLQLLMAKKNGLTIAAIMLFQFKDRVSVEMSTSDESFKDYSPVHFLFWKAIELAYEKGYKIFDFGRTSPHNISLMNFKKRWGTHEVDLAHYFYPANMAKSIDQKEESWQYKIVRRMASLNIPGPLQKLMGAFLYRHMG